jgi:hypothetical protein
MTAPRKINGRTREAAERMCLSKVRWSDELAARAGAMQALEARPDVRRLYTYKCLICSGWHLTRKWVRGCQPVKAEKGVAHAV